MTLLQTPLTLATAVTASATLAAGKHTPVDATSGAVTMTLPTPAHAGARLRVEKVDTSTNAVTISGSIRGSASTIPLTSQYESMELFAESLTSWRPAAKHTTKAALDATYATTATVGAVRRNLFTSGRWYAAPGYLTSAASLTTNRMRAAPFPVDTDTSFTQIASEITVLDAAATLRWVVYSSDAGGYPKDLLLDTGAVGSAATTGVKTQTITLTLPRGGYWLSCIPQGGNPTFRCHSGAGAAGVGLVDLATFSVTTATGVFASSITGAAPTPFPAGSEVSSTAPIVWLQAA